MNEIMRKLLEMSLYGSIAIILTILFRFLFRKAPKKITSLFWIAAAIRLICPFNFSMGLGLMNLFEKKSVPSKITVPVGHGLAPKVAAGNAVANEVAVEAATQSAGSSINVYQIMLIVWAIGVLAIMGVTIYRSVRLQRFIRKGTVNADVIESNKVDTAFVAGLIRPTIVIPKLMDKSEREYLILHEKVHIKNKDNLTRALGLFIVSIHWFNPLVWIGFNMLCNDLEMRVDEEVIDRVGNGIKKDYCMSIVNHAMRSSRYKVIGASFAKKTLSGMEVKMRINNLINYRKISGITAAVIVVSTLGITTVLSSCANQDPNGTALSSETSAGEELTIVTTEEKDTEWSLPEGVNDSSDFTVVDEDESVVFLDSLNSSLGYSDKYVADYGEEKEVKYKDLNEKKNSFEVTSDYYADTDFNSLAKQYEELGYKLKDIPLTCSVFGGMYFKEGFYAEIITSEGVTVVRADEETITKYITEDYESIAYDITDSSMTEEGNIKYYDYSIHEIIGEDVDFNYTVNVQLDTTTNIAIITRDIPDYGN